MTTQYTDLTEHEAKAAAGKRLGMLIRVVETVDIGAINFLGGGSDNDFRPTPATSDSITSAFQDGEFRIWSAEYPEEGYVALHCPFGPPGTVLHCREEWALPPSYNPDVHGDLSSQPRIGPVCFKEGYPSWNPWPGTMWQPASEMPDFAIRHRPTVGEVRCKRFGSLDEKEALAAGYKPFWDSENPVRHKMPDGRVITGEPAESAKEAMRRALKCDDLTWLWLATLTQN